MNKEDRDYLQERLNQYLEPMLIDFLSSRPSDPLDWMINWMKSKGRTRP